MYKIGDKRYWLPSDVLPTSYFEWPSGHCNEEGHDRFAINPQAPEGGKHYCGCIECRVRWEEE
jgi:hypothetical protein